MDELRIRVYNVMFGDAILVSFPEKDVNGQPVTRHILIDIGNRQSNDVFEQVVTNILEVLNGAPLDLYISTHEHMDHVEGLPWAEYKYYPVEYELKNRLNTQYSWFTASAKLGYYDEPSLKAKYFAMYKEVYDNIDRYLEALRSYGKEIPSEVENLWLINYRRGTKACVEYLCEIAPKVHYIHREYQVPDMHPFTEAELEILAPEKDTSIYFMMNPLTGIGLGVTTKTEEGKKTSSITEVTPPPGVYSGSFYNLVKTRRRYIDNLLAIDSAGNNTSIVFCLKWQGIKLLFSGDAEWDSWGVMSEKNVLDYVHFLKVSHHGSINGTPCDEILDKFLPLNKQDDVPRNVVLSTWDGTYSSIPDQPTLEELKQRCDNFHDTRCINPGDYFDITYKPYESYQLN